MNSTRTKQKLVIVLKGVPNSGKTTTLNYLIQLLQGVEAPSPLTKDRRVLIPYQGKRVYVATPGDFEYEIFKSIVLSEIGECDILVTAVRSRGRTRQTIDEYVQVITVQQDWVEKRRVNEHIDKENETQAQELKVRIDAFIKEHP